MKKTLILGLLLCLALVLSPIGTVTYSQSSADEQVIFLPGNTHRVCQLTGKFSPNATDFTAKIHGTDLGYSFEHMAKNSTGGSFNETIFLFGDTLGLPETHPDTLDSIAFANDSNPEDCIDLDFVTELSDPFLYHPPQIVYPEGVEPIQQFALGIPSYGFSGNSCPDGSEKIYTIFSSFNDEITKTNPIRTVLAYSCDRGRTFHYLYDFSVLWFINGSAVVVDAQDIPGLPQSSGKGVLVWGSGAYRQSNVHLAYVPLDQVETRSAWRFYTDPPLPEQGHWAQLEGFATSVLNTTRSPQQPTPCVGELSVTWNQYLNKWLLLYNCNKIDNPPSPSQVRFHVADQPWGPWSEFMQAGPGGASTILFIDGREDTTDYMFRPGRSPTLQDNLLFPDASGDPYGPYVITRYTTGDSRSTTIYYTLSTWNPYQVQLMKSTLRLQRPPVANAGPDQTVTITDECSVQVRLDGTGSSDPDGDSLTYRWTGPFGTVTGPTPTVTLPLGTSTITLTVDDGLGGTASDQVVITVQDTTPPTLSVTLSPTTLWPPNHELVPVTAMIEAQDNCDASPAVTLVSITSNEPDNGLGDGDHANDIQNAVFGTEDRVFLLRAERSGLGTGRIYTITYRAQDASGNATMVTLQVTVPHD